MIEAATLSVGRPQGSPQEEISMARVEPVADLSGTSPGRLGDQRLDVMQSSDDAIIRKDRDGVMTSWTDGAEPLFGYTYRIRQISCDDRHCAIEWIVAKSSQAGQPRDVPHGLLPRSPATQ